MTFNLTLGGEGDGRRVYICTLAKFELKQKIWLINVKNFLSPEPKYKGKKKIFFFFCWFSIIYMFHAILNPKNEKKILTQSEWGAENL